MDATVPTTFGRVLLAFIATLLAAVALGGVTAAAQPGDPAPRTPALLPAQLDELVAPVALYPDIVLDSLLPATAAPADVAAAARFVASQGGRPTRAPEAVAWDASVAALLQFPYILAWLGDNPAWVERMGFAVTTQQPDVLAAIQRYRTRAYDLGLLASNPYQDVTVEPGPVVTIVAVNSSLVCVPVYDPWGLDDWVPGGRFFRSWLWFSFGEPGFWGRYRIFWGTGIYCYDDPWWWSRWHSHAIDWDRDRPALWMAERRSDQPWTQRGWHGTVGSVRPAVPLATITTPTVRSVFVTPPFGTTVPLMNRHPGPALTPPLKTLGPGPVLTPPPVSRSPLLRHSDPAVHGSFPFLPTLTPPPTLPRWIWSPPTTRRAPPRPRPAPASGQSPRRGR